MVAVSSLSSRGVQKIYAITAGTEAQQVEFTKSPKKVMVLNEGDNDNIQISFDGSTYMTVYPMSWINYEAGGSTLYVKADTDVPVKILVTE